MSSRKGAEAHRRDKSGRRGKGIFLFLVFFASLRLGDLAWAQLPVPNALPVPNTLTEANWEPMRWRADALEARYPMLRGTIREHGTLKRRAFVRFFACEEDLSHEPPDAALPAAVASGREPFFVVGAMAGG